jgi:hypothetical protein
MTYALDQYMLARNMNTHGAIAYNSSTGIFSWSFGYWGEGAASAADQRALSGCPGGQIVAHGQGNAFMALALLPNRSWGSSQGATAKYAKKHALRNCSRHGRDAQIVLVVNALRGLQEQHPSPIPRDQAPVPAQQNMSIGWGAISYSPSTNTYTYVTREYENLAQLYARGRLRQPDATVVVWGFNTFLALARCRGVYCGGYGDTADEAEQGALDSCRAHGPDPEVLLVIHTMDEQPIKPAPTRPPKLVRDQD